MEKLSFVAMCVLHALEFAYYTRLERTSVVFFRTSDRKPDMMCGERAARRRRRSTERVKANKMTLDIMCGSSA